MSLAHFRHRLPRKSPRLRAVLFAVAVTAGAAVTIPALADTDPSVRLVVGLAKTERATAAPRLKAKGFRLHATARLNRLGAQTLVVPKSDVSEVSTSLRAQSGVAFVQVDEKATASAADEPSATDPPTPTADQTTPPATDQPAATGTPAPPAEPTTPPTTPPTTQPQPTETTGSPTAAPASETAGPTQSPSPAPPSTPAELAQIGLPAAWQTATTWADPIVAVLDTGVSPVAELKSVLLPGTNVIDSGAGTSDDSDNSHGTAMASLVHAACPACQVLPVKVLDNRGTGYDTQVAEGIVYAADQNAKVINLSLGHQDRTANAGSLLQSAIDYARGKGAVVIASAGTDLRNNEHGVLKQYPAANAGVLGVGGTNSAGGRYTAKDDPAGVTGSNYGTDWVDLAAPYCATVLDNTGAPQPMCGTSTSTALVSGVAGLIRSRSPLVDAWTVENGLTSTATAPSASDKWVAYGEIRADLAVMKIDTTPPRITDTIPSYLTHVRGTVTVTATGVTDSGGGYPQGSGIGAIALYADGQWVGIDYTAPYSVNFNTGSRNGVVKLQWKVWDNASNSSVFYRNIVADNTPPALSLSAPATKAKVGKTVKVKATASDASGIQRIELRINGKLVKTVYGASFSYTVNTHSFSKTMKVQVGVYDKVGNVRYSPTRTWHR